MKERPSKSASRNRPWVIVWTARQDDQQHIPHLYERGAEGRCPFEHALELAHSWAGPERVAPVVLRPHRPWWSQPVGSLPAENLAEQPFNRGSAPGVLLAVLRTYRKDPDAKVILLSADSDLRASLHLEEALEQVEGRDDIVLLARGGTSGMVTAYRRTDGKWRVTLEAGSTVGGGVIVASARALLQLFVDTQPQLTDQFLTTLTGPALFDDQALDQLYPFLPSTDFLAEVLARVPRSVRPDEPGGRPKYATRRAPNGLALS